MIFNIFSMIVLTLAGGIGYSRLRRDDSIDGLIKRTKEHLEVEDYENAGRFYMMAREVFNELEHDKKIKNHPELLRLHGILKRYSMIKEAQMLTEKYEKGMITDQEMERLNYLMFGP